MTTANLPAALHSHTVLGELDMYITCRLNLVSGHTRHVFKLLFFMNKCPKNCSGGNSTSQHELSEGQFKKLSDGAKEAITASKDMAYRCSYCGCVYVGTRSLGILDGGILGEGWHSRNYA